MSDDTQRPKAPASQPVGTIVKVKARSEVTRPDGTTSTVTGGSYVLDVPGVFVIDGDEVKAR